MHQWEFTHKKAGRLHIFSLTICSHTSYFMYYGFPGAFVCNVVPIWVSGVESSAWQTVILYKTFHRKPKDALSSFYSGLITWCPRLSFIRKKLHNFPDVSHSQICHMAFKQGDSESEKLKRKIDFPKSLTVLCHMHFIQNSVILHYLRREAHSGWCSGDSKDILCYCCKGWIFWVFSFPLHGLYWLLH